MNERALQKERLHRVDVTKGNLDYYGGHGVHLWTVAFLPCLISELLNKPKVRWIISGSDHI